jgi:hypothetical protein
MPNSDTITIAEIDNAVKDVFKEWQSLRNNLTSKLDGKYKTLFLAMTIPSLKHDLKFEDKKVWRRNYAISQMNEKILTNAGHICSVPFRGTLTYDVVTLGTTSKTKYNNVRYTLYDIGEMFSDGLHNNSKGNDYIANKIVEKIKPWIMNF